MSSDGWGVSSNLEPDGVIEIAGEWIVNHPTLEIGDEFTFEGEYQRRTFWQWLMRKPKQLQRYRVVSTV